MEIQDCSINPEFKQEVFRNIEKTGEGFKEQFEQLTQLAKKRIDSQVNCSKFEAVYGFTVSKKERQKTMKDLREVRNELWKDALKKAKGDVKKAYAFYDKDSSFP